MTVLNRRRARFVGLTGLLALSSTTSVTPQTPDPRAPPRAPQTPREPQGPDDPNDLRPAAPSAPRWQFSLGLLGGYESNIDFREPALSDFGGTLRTSLGRNWRGPRGRFSLVLSGSGVAYREQSEANRADGAVNLAWNQQLSPRVGFSLAGYGARDTTTSQRFLTDIGQVLPRSQSWNFGGSTGFDFKLGQRASLRMNGRYGRVSFDDPTLVSSQSGAGDLSLAQRLGVNDELSLYYGFLRSKDEAQEPLDSHYGGLGWTRRLSRQLSLSLSGGAGYNPRVMDAIQQAWYFYGSAGLQGQWRRATLLAQIRQSVTPAYGLGGNQISDIASLSATIPLGRRTDVSIGGSHLWGRARSGDQSAYTSDDGNLTLGVRLFRHAGLSLGYGYRRNQPDEQAAVESHRGFLGFTYTRP